MSTARLTSAPTLFSLSLGADLGDLTLAQLAQAHGNADHEFNRMVACKCTRCQTDLVAPQLSAAIGVACDECRKKAKIADSMERSRIYWETLCPPSYQDTDKNHRDFPKLQYGATQDYAGEESLFFYGPSRSGKTRIAMLLLKRCLVRYNKHVGVLWPEVLKSVNHSRDVLEMVKAWGRYDVLLMDDSLLSGAHDERVTSFLKDLLDYRMRYKRHNIITSQIGGDDYKAQSDKFKNSTKADMERIEALLKRIKEVCRVVPFVEAMPSQGEQNF